MRNKVEVISLFSGAGGLDYAFETTGLFSTALFVEKEPVFAETIRINQRAGHLSAGIVIEDDIALMDPHSVLSDTIGTERKPWVVIGGPPCESFSAMGKQKGRFDKRGAVIFSFANWVNSLPIRAFLMENVPGLLTIESGGVFRDLVREFRRGGYTLSYKVLCAADYGAATVRRRLFVVGVRELPQFVFPEPSHQDSRSGRGYTNLPEWIASESVLSDLPPPSERRPGEPQGHVVIKHTEAVKARFESLGPGEVDRIRKRNRLHPDFPSPGLYAGNMEGIRFHIHPNEPREITNREAARLQGFPDVFSFCGSRVAVGKQIANAVPIALGQALATAMHSQYIRNNRVVSNSS